MGMPKVKSVSIRESVLEALRTALLERRFGPGESLPDASLAAEMNVSRGPVREALLVLEQEGLVTHSQNYGFSVVKFSDKDQEETQQVRYPLETLALKLARQHVTQSVIDRLRHLASQISHAYAAGEAAELAQRDLTFHSLIWDLSGNSRLAGSLRTLMVPYFAYGAIFNIVRPGLTAELLEEEHRAYVVYLGGDPSRTADECVRFHLGLPES